MGFCSPYNRTALGFDSNMLNCELLKVTKVLVNSSKQQQPGCKRGDSSPSLEAEAIYNIQTTFPMGLLLVVPQNSELVGTLIHFEDQYQGRQRCIDFMLCW